MPTLPQYTDSLHSFFTTQRSNTVFSVQTVQQAWYGSTTMSEIDRAVETVVGEWTVTEHSYGGAPYATARRTDCRQWSSLQSVEFDGTEVEIEYEASCEGSCSPSVPIAVIDALVSIHNRRLATVGT